jgi:hypothetical protein
MWHSLQGLRFFGGLLLFALALPCLAQKSKRPAAGPALRAATFRADFTPPLGSAMIWTQPLTKVEDPLWAKGIILEQAGTRYVLVAIDWCGIGGELHQQMRATIGEAAGTSEHLVALHSVHQHTAPYAISDAWMLLRERGMPVLETPVTPMMPALQDAIRAAVKRLEPVDRVAYAETTVERVASARRIPNGRGGITTRWSTSRDATLMQLPESFPGATIDPLLRTLHLQSGKRTVASLHFYATHPQTHCCDGTASGDFVGHAREAMEQESGVPQIWFTAGAGDITVGKYNDGSVAARSALRDRLLAALRKAATAARRAEVPGKLSWRYETFEAPRIYGNLTAKTPEGLYREAIRVSFAQRAVPLVANALHMGRSVFLFLPGEPMQHFEKLAHEQAAGRHVFFAGYGDMHPGYLCTDKAFEEGGYEPSAAHGSPPLEKFLSDAIKSLLLP